MELLKKGYSPVERAQVENLLEEQKFQLSDVTSQEQIAQAGKILNVPAVIVINIPNFKEEISMTAKMIDVQDASIIWIGNGSGTTGRTIATIVGAAAGAGAGVVAAGENNQAAGGIIGGVLGGAAGQALSPQQAQKTQEIVQFMCINFPYRTAGGGIIPMK